MGILKRLIKEATKPIRAEMHGEEGERKVDSKLNPLLFGRVNHRQINNLILLDDNGKSHQIDHIEIRKNGIFCIETKSYIGWVFGDENSSHWTQTLYTGEKHQLLNPIKQNKSHCYHVNKVLKGKYIINSVVVMANNNANKIKCSNVVNLNDLRSYLKNFDNGVSLSEDEMDDIYHRLKYSAADMTNREHIRNIRQTQKEINNNICPRCGGELKLRKGSKGNFYGCSNYPTCTFIKNV